MSILVIDGHPSRKSFSAALAEQYAEGVRSAQGKVEVLHLSELKFDPILHEGYREIMPLEPDLKRAQDLILQAKHLVFFYPQWWGSGPAILKGFIDRVFLPGYGFKYHAKGPFWDKLLKGRSAEIWLLSDSPKYWIWFQYWSSPVKWLKVATLEFCGITPVQVRHIDRVRFLNVLQRKEWMDQALHAGKKKAEKFQ